MLRRKIRAVRRSPAGYCIISIPKVWTDEMNLVANDVVTLERKGRSIIVTPVASNPAKDPEAAEDRTHGNGGSNE